MIISLYVTSNLIAVPLAGDCEFPEGMDSTTTTRFKLKGIEGLFITKPIQAHMVFRLLPVLP